VRIFKLSGDEKVVSAIKIDDNFSWYYLWRRLVYILGHLIQ
jgi:hypothetical protein